MATMEATVGTIETLDIRLKHVPGAHPVDDQAEDRILSSLAVCLKKASDIVRKGAKSREQESRRKAEKNFPYVEPKPVNIPTGSVALHTETAKPEVHFGQTCIDIKVPVQIDGEHWTGLTAALSHELAGVVGNCEVIVADTVL